MELVSCRIEAMRGTPPGMSTFIIIITGILLLLYVYSGWRLITPLELSRGKKGLWWGALFFPFVVLWVTPVFYRSWDGQPSLVMDGLLLASYLVMGFLAYLVFLLIGLDLLVAGQRILGGVAKILKLNQEADAGRRVFVGTATSLGIVGAAGALMGAGFVQAKTGPMIKRTEIPVPDLHPDLDGFTICQMSDIHIGPTLRGGFMQSLVDQANALKPDLIAVTGDLVDGLVEQIGSHVAPIGGLKAKYGTYFCTGNHEYYSGVDEWCSFVSQQGLIPLRNQHRVVSVGRAKLLVGGVNDHQATRFGEASDPHASLQGAPQVDFKMILAHQPKSCEDAAQAGYDLQLSGHTHAGQFIPFNLLAVWAQPYFKGLNRHKDKLWVYVNQGTGYWGPPIRLGVPSEITLLTLKRA